MKPDNSIPSDKGGNSQQSIIESAETFKAVYLQALAVSSQLKTS